MRNPMAPNEVEETFEEMLDAAGVAVARASMTETWAVFKRFAAITIDGIEDEDDGFLFDWRTYREEREEPERFVIHFLRQFSMSSESGEYDHMEQLHCLFNFESTQESRALGSGHDWWFRSERQRNLDDWIAEIESLPPFEFGLRSESTQLSSVIEQAPV